MERRADAGAPAPRVVVVMGVAGSGKSTVAAGLHSLLGWPFMEGDSLHPDSNVSKMSAGDPLTDEDREPWLDQCRVWLDACAASGTGGILSCSALKRAYRDRLRSGGTRPVFIFLRVERDVLADRLKRRRGHFMPVSLLGSQMETLEPPDHDEDVIELDASGTPAEEIRRVILALRQTDLV